MATNKPCIEIPNRFKSLNNSEDPAIAHIVAGADDIYDDDKAKKQSVVNQETDTALANRYTKDETYSKNELNNLITTPNQQYVSVTATDQTTAVTDVLPAEGSADTVYRVGNWDGTQYDDTVYSEYAWNGTSYVHLSTKTLIGEVFDISAYHATGGVLAEYADLTAALGTNGANIPDALRKGGMSVKFVQSSDHKYVQYRYMGTVTTGTPNPFFDAANWQGVDSELSSNNHNLIESGGVYPILVKIDLEETVTLETVNVNVKLDKMIPVGSTVKSIHGYTGILRGRTNSSDATWFGLSDGVVVDRDICWVNGSITGDVTITIESISTKITDLQQKNTEQDVTIEEVKSANNTLASSVSIPVTFENADTTTWYKLPFTVKAGSYVVFKTNNQILYGKTTDSPSENYESLSTNTAATKDINYIRFTETGDCTVIFSGIFYGQRINTDNIDGLYATLNIPRLFIGHLTTSSVWRPYDGFHYMLMVKPGDNVAVTKNAGVSNTYYAILKSYNVQKKELVFATGCSLVSLSTGTTSKVVVPSDGNYLYVSYTNNTTNAQASSVVINGYDVLNESIIGNLVKDRDNIKNLQNILGYEYVTPEISYSTGDGKYISKKGAVTTNTNYEYSNPISVKRNDVLLVTGFGGSDYCCLALSVSNDVFTPLVNYSDVGIDKEVHFFYVCKEDCLISLSSRKTYGNLVILRGLDISINMILANILGIPSVAGITYSESMVNPDECLDNMKLDSTRPATPYIDSNYWVTNFIPVNDTNWLFCNYDHPTRVVCYDENKQFVRFVGSAAIPIEVNTFAYPTTKYMRIQFAKSLVSFDDRYKVRIVKSVYNPNNSSPCNKIDGSLVGIRNIAYVNNDDIAKFEADKIYGSYVSATVFNVDGEAVELDTTSVYIDKSTKRQYRYDGTGLYDVGYYDDKSLIFTESFSIDIPKTELSIKNLIVTASAKYYQGSGVTDKPTVQLSNYATNNLQAATIPYVIGGDRCFKQKEWRAQVLNYQQYKTIVNITIPTGVTLFIDKFGNYYSDKKGYGTFPRVNAHAFAAPDNTIMYIEQNAKLGFACMITIPKRTYDGVWVCFHDDDKITRYARHEDGSVLTNADIPQNAPGTITSIEDCPIGYFTYEELMQFDFGIYNSYDRFKPNMGQKIPLLKDFFMICAKTGIHPMLSIHPNYTSSEWQEVKDMTDGLSLTSKLNLKFGGGASYFATTYSVFGTEIESYAVDVSTNIDYTNTMLDAITDYNIDIIKVRIGIEYYKDVVTVEKVNNARTNGMFTAVVMSSGTSEDYEYWMERGVSEFTDDNHTSVGLNW